MSEIQSGWFLPIDRRLKLHFEADRWLGTPFFPNSCAPGPDGGVSCQQLVAALYREAGFADVVAPEVPMSHARFNTKSLVEDFMAARHEFRRLPKVEADLAQPGDLLGFRLFRVIHHLGICLEPGVFIHAIEHLGSIKSSLADPTWGKRLAAIWRPIET